MSELLSVKEFCDRHGKDRGNALRLIQAGRIPAVRVGNQWCIPEGTPWPADARVKSGKYKDWRKPKGEPPAE